jgi:glutathione synthase
MRICFVVGAVASQQPSYGAVHLAWAAHRRGHEVRFVSAAELSFLDDNSILGRTTRVRAGEYARPADYLRALLSDQAVHEEEALSGFDVVFLRYNPLVEPGSGTGSPVLDLCWRLRLAGTLVVNDPEGLRRAAGGMYLADLPPEIRARTLVSRSPARLKEFLRGLDGPAVLKALAPGGSEKVFYLRRRQVANLNQMITALTKTGYAVAQEYLPESEQGEKRLLLLGGAPLRVGKRVAIYRRVPALLEGSGGDPTAAASSSGEGRHGANGASGRPRRKKCEFGPVEERLAELVRPKLLADGIYLCAVDVVGDRILQLNVFTPGGFQSVREIYGLDAAEHVIGDIERRVRLRLAYRTTYDPEAADVV